MPQVPESNQRLVRRYTLIIGDDFAREQKALCEPKRLWCDIWELDRVLDAFGRLSLEKVFSVICRAMA